MNPESKKDPSKLAEEVEVFRRNALFDSGSRTLTPTGDQHFYLALAALEAAQAHFRLAALGAVQTVRDGDSVTVTPFAKGGVRVMPWTGKVHAAYFDRVLGSTHMRVSAELLSSDPDRGDHPCDCTQDPEKPDIWKVQTWKQSGPNSFSPGKVYRARIVLAAVAGKISGSQ